VDCTLLAGGTAAEITVVAPNRPGLLSDISSTIAALGLTIDRAQVTTPDERAKDTFTVRSRTTGELLSATRMSSIRTAILAGASTARDPLQAATAVTPAVSARVEVCAFAPDGGLVAGDQWVVSVECSDSPGMLSKIMRSITSLGLDVASADVRTSLGHLTSQFAVSKPVAATQQAVIDELKAALAK